MSGGGCRKWLARLLLGHETRRGRVAWISVGEPGAALGVAARRPANRAPFSCSLLFRPGIAARLYSSVLACSSLHIRHDQYSPDRVCTHGRRYTRSAQVCVSREIHLPIPLTSANEFSRKTKSIDPFPFFGTLRPEFPTFRRIFPAFPENGAPKENSKFATSFKPSLRIYSRALSKSRRLKRNSRRDNALRIVNQGERCRKGCEFISRSFDYFAKLKLAKDSDVILF